MNSILKTLTYVFLIASISVLASCATTPPAAPAANQTESWDKREQQLTQIKNWNINAQVAARSSNNAWSATMQWSELPNSYSILLFGPLGAGATKLNGQQGNVQLQTADGKIYHAASPEELLAQQLGWRLPVSNLIYWVRGLPVPGIPAQKQMDAYHHLTILDQQGWHIQFLSYTSVNQIDLPNKIFLNNSQLNVKMIINSWQF